MQYENIRKLQFNNINSREFLGKDIKTFDTFVIKNRIKQITNTNYQRHEMSKMS